MKWSPPVRCFVLILCGLLGTLALEARASSILLDFDEDGDPMTIRTSLPLGVTTATARFVLDVDADVPNGVQFLGFITEGCCNDPPYEANYGVRADFGTVQFYPEFVSNLELLLPT